MSKPGPCLQETHTLGAGDKTGARGMINKEHRAFGRREQPRMVSWRASAPGGRRAERWRFAFEAPESLPLPPTPPEPVV